ncbi:MAG TPA: PBP1A family penicillin-binding protein, partial [Candidatus Limnocylindria bacterium]|nr:PBP1A family penicillin-binding protein [Candidatus Limnocylindria bacterium]
MRWGLALGLLGGTVAGVILYLEITSALPPVDQLLTYRPPVATRVFADDGTPIAEFFVERRYLVPLERIPVRVRQAFLAAEDADFYEHRGIDPISIARALWTNLRSSGIRQGASTITQQVVKTLLLTPERSFERKLKEAILALRLETKLSKDDILYMYLNEIYFGAGAYGVQAAAKTFFDVDVEHLTLAQAALLAGLPQRPSQYDPQRHLDRALVRQHYVLERMAQEGFITPVELRDALQEEIRIAPRRPQSYLAAPWYVEHVRRLLEERFGGTYAAQLGLRVYTAVNLPMQQAADAAVRLGLQQFDERHGYRGPITRLAPDAIDDYLASEAARPHAASRHAVVTGVDQGGLLIRTADGEGAIAASGLEYGGRVIPPSRFAPGDVITVVPDGTTPSGLPRFALSQDPIVQGALVAFDPYTGEVKALTGGYEFGASHFNRAVQAKRQPGSAFKPLLYAAAMEKRYTPASIVLDAPIELPAGNGRIWRPRNYNDRYYGPVPLREALSRSLNTVSVRLVDELGPDYVRRYLTRFGFSTEFPRNLSIALGSSEVTLLELTRAYGVFATLGKRFDPIFITRVTDDAGNPLDFADTRPHFERVMSPALAYLVTNLMESVVKEGTARAALALGRPLAGKTGTTNESRDAWFIGYSPDLLAGAWVGYDSHEPLGGKETGSRAALPIWMAFMERALAGRPPVDFPVPPGVTYVSVDPASGLRAVPGGAAVREVFIAGTEPQEYAPL